MAYDEYMFLATSNKPRRLLHFSYIGKVGVAELERGSLEVNALLAELPPGLKIVVDLERMESMDIGCAEIVGQMMELLEKHGVDLVLRIIPDPTKDIGLNLISRFHYHHRPRIATFKSLAEVAGLLAV